MTTTVTHPHWIGVERPVFASYEGPAADARDLGVLLCKPFGYEMLCAHRAYRRLAERLAGEGLHVLRLDYDGTGDSSGGDADPGRVTAWLGSIDAGLRELEAHGARRLALVGVRFGALLAAEYARRRPVDALVLVSPPASGRTYLRELRAFQAMRPAFGAPRAAGDGEEVAGFLLTAETAAELSKLSVVGEAAPARRVLVVARDDVPGPEAKLAEQLGLAGARVTVSRTAGYAEMMQQDPVKSVVPEAIWAEVSAWLVEGASAASVEPPAAPVAGERVAGVRRAEGAPKVLEEIVDVDGMKGVLTTPDRGEEGGPFVVLPNVGANHRVGCNRVYVDFAREWAAAGLSVLRFDLVGIGDTPPEAGRAENAVYSDACVDDARRALSWLARRRPNARFTLGGICSGAYVSYYAALADPRVESVVLVNPLTFRWREGDSLDVRMRQTLKASHFYRQALWDPATWARAARGQVHVRAIATKMAARVLSQVKRLPARWGGGDRTEVAAGVRRLCARGTRVLLVCGEDDGSRDVVEEHLGPDARDLRGLARFEYDLARETDHTFSPFAARRALTERLTAFLLGGSRRSARAAGGS